MKPHNANVSSVDDRFLGVDGAPLRPNTPQRLSEARAEAVCAAVVASAALLAPRHAGMLRALLFPVGCAGDRPAVRDPAAPGAAAANRRVECHILTLGYDKEAARIRANEEKIEQARAPPPMSPFCLFVVCVDAWASFASSFMVYVFIY